MRSLAVLMFLAATLPALAQSPARPRPPGTVALEEPPALAPQTAADAALEPQVTTRQEGPNVVQEYRIRGKLYMMRVTTPGGRPYILMDHKGDGTFSRQDNTLDPGVRVPQWVLLEF